MIFSFVGQELNQCRPGGVSNISAIFLFLQQTFYIQSLMSNEVIFVYKFFRSFMAKVFTFVFDSLVNLAGIFFLMSLRSSKFFL
jgi:hypothetical protein